MSKNSATPSNGTFTSDLAAQLADQRMRSGQALKILEALEAAKTGLTAEELEDKTGVSGNSIRPRLLRLEKVGLVARQKNIFKFTNSGRLANVWQLNK